MSMDIDTPVALPSRPLIPQASATYTVLAPPGEPHADNLVRILCCNCGAPIDGTSAAGALCYDCVKLTVDISEGIQREATLHICRE